jgi:hypothetical protein
MPRGDLLQVEIALENVQEFVVYQAGSMHAQQLRASRDDCRQHDVEVRDALIMGKLRLGARASAAAPQTMIPTGSKRGVLHGPTQKAEQWAVPPQPDIFNCS